VPVQKLPQFLRRETFAEKIEPPIAFQHDGFHGEFERVAIQEQDGERI
jgi:hypothetical protein